MKLFDSIPFFRYLFFFIGGILITAFCELDISILVLGGVFIGGVLLFIIIKRTRVSQILIPLLCFVMGVSAVHLFLDQPSRTITDAQYHIVELQQTPRTKTNSKFCKAKIIKSKINETWQLTNVNLNLHLSLESDLYQWDVLLLHEGVDTIKENTNPAGFDFKEFYAKKNIYYSLFLKKEDYTVVSLGAVELSLRDQLVGRLGYLFPQREKQFLQALLFGDKSALGENLKKHFQHAGIMHILAVSGLHVGIVYAIIQFLFSLILKSNSIKIRVIRTLLILFGIWAYIFLVGYMPSVVRAGIMLTVFHVGTLLQRKVNFLNMICFTAFVILVFRPLDVFDVGFQLSFIAVTGIIYITPLLTEKIILKNRVLDFFFQVCAVSIAAQVSTLPLCIYYFGYFPNLFLISNIVVALLIPVIMTGGGLALVVGSIPYLGNFVIWLEIKVIQLLFTFTDWIATLSFSIADNLYISKVQVFVFILLNSTIVLALRNRSKLMLYTSTLLLVLSLCLSMYNTIYFRSQKEFVVFDAGKEACFGVLDAQCLFINSTWSDKSIAYIKTPYLRLHNAKDDLLTMQNIGDENTLFSHEGFTCMQVSKAGYRSTEVFDVVIVSNNAIRTIEGLQSLKAKHIIFDGSNYKNVCETLEGKVSDFNIHFVPLEGAFEMKL